MYEDYLENFVFKTAKEIAMKLFGKVKKSKNQPESETEPETKNDETKDTAADSEGNGAEDEEAEEEENIEQAIEEIEETQTEPTEEDLNTERALKEAMETQRAEKLKKQEELAAERVDYDAITEGLSEINFHLPLFFLLLLLTLMSLPSVVTWAKNYHHAKLLSPDPMLIPATCVLVALGFIWQLPTPRNLWVHLIFVVRQKFS